MRFNTLAQWLDWQSTLHPREIELGLERVAAVWRRLCPGGLACPVVTGAGTGSLAGLDLDKLGIPDLGSVIARYEARTGLAVRPGLDFYLAYNFFRIAAILQGIAGRVRDGTAASAHAAQAGKAVQPLATIGWEHARRSG